MGGGDLSGDDLSGDDLSRMIWRKDGSPLLEEAGPVTEDDMTPYP